MRIRRGRFLETTLGDPFSNLALEEVLFTGLHYPTLRIWENQRSVVIGRAQLARAEADLEYCHRTSAPVVRRFTAGGAVYNGPGNLNWPFFVPRGEGGTWGRAREVTSWNPATNIWFIHGDRRGCPRRVPGRDKVHTPQQHLRQSREDKWNGSLHFEGGSPMPWNPFGRR